MSDIIYIYRNTGEMDELYGLYFDCPNPECDCSEIGDNFNYCPMCGKQIMWIGKNEE